MRHYAIRNVHSNVVTISGDEWGELRAWDGNGNDVAIDQSAVDAEEVNVKAAFEAAEAAVVANKASTKAKLEALGLTVDEIRDAFNI